MGTAQAVPDVAAIASAFVGILKAWFTPEEYEVVKMRNAAEEDKNICHSQDFCDANMAMAEAMESVGIKDFDAGDEAHAKVWNAAWQLAWDTDLRVCKGIEYTITDKMADILDDEDLWNKAEMILEIRAVISHDKILAALKSLVSDCMASDFNEHWDSFKNASAVVAQIEGR